SARRTSRPETARQDLAAYAGCVTGAVLSEDVENMLADAGFTDISIKPQDTTRELVREWSPGTRLEDCVVSAMIEARKP
ncbi:MAG: arsenite methyltransferase, partial [Gemmatimonadota bacterium]|nr:arsenite methyltransferase [Gemmatimonadota bacterium]